MIRTLNGQLVAVEIKVLGAPFRPSQIGGFGELGITGGIPRGGNAAEARVIGESIHRFITILIND